MFTPHIHLRRRLLLILLAVLGSQVSRAQFDAYTDLDQLYYIADSRSSTAKASQTQLELAELQKVAAYANTLNLKGTASITATDNFKLPVNFLPAEIFGGPSGTFRQVTFGQQFVNVAAISPQLDLIAPSTWPRVQSAKASMALTQLNSQVSMRTLKESIATAYCNQGALAAQLEIARANLTNAETILDIARKRYKEGLIREQDRNNAQANKINLANFVDQLEQRVAISQLQIRTLIGLPADDTTTYRFRQPNHRTYPQKESNGYIDLQARQAKLQTEVQRHELHATRLSFMPTLSLVAAFNWQQNSNEAMFSDADWIASRYVGFRLSMPLPTETRIWSQAEEYRINLKLKQINAEQVQLQEQARITQLRLEATRAYETYAANAEITMLKMQNAAATQRLYEDGLASMDQMLTADIESLNAQMAEANALWDLELQLQLLKLYQY